MEFSKRTSTILVALLILAAGGVFLLQQNRSEQIPVTETPASEGTPIAEEPETQSTLPEKVDNQIPFAAQAPFGDWADPRQQDGCEEASVVMAMRWVTGEGLTRQQMLDEIIKMSAWEEEKYGSYHDTSAEDTVKRLFNEYFNYNKVSVDYDFTIEDIKKELADGNLVLAPFNGQTLGNPYYTGDGPERHFMVIKGYDEARGQFITNDPGTRQGANYRYSYKTIFDSIRDYPTGDHIPILGVAKAIIVVSK